MNRGWVSTLQFNNQKTKTLDRLMHGQTSNNIKTTFMQQLCSLRKKISIAIPPIVVFISHSLRK